MTKEELIKLYIGDLKSIVSQSEARDARIKQLEDELQNTSDNSDYATALKVWDEFGDTADGMLDSQFGYWVTQRLNQSKD